MNSILSMASTSAPAQLLECSICWDRFTDPRMLPCQHTFCATCLENLYVNDSFVSCPQCRARHALPPGRVQGLPGNFLLNNLLSMPQDTYSPTVRSTVITECFDCEVKSTVSECDHCRRSICVQCLVQHTKLSQNVHDMLERVRESLTKPAGDRSTEQVKASLRAVKLEREKMNFAVHEQAASLLQALETRQAQLDGVFEILVNIHEDLLHPEDRKPFLDTLSQQAMQSRSTQSLQRLIDSLKGVKTIARRVSGQQAVAHFVSEPIEAHLKHWGRVQVGETVLRDGIGNLTRRHTPKLSRPGSADGIAVPEQSRQSLVVPHVRAQRKVESVSSVRVSSFADPHSTRQMSHRQSSLPQGNLPRNIDYGRIGESNVSIIGPISLRGSDFHFSVMCMSPLGFSTLHDG